MFYSEIFLVGKLVFQFSAFKGFFCVLYLSLSLNTLFSFK